MPATATTRPPLNGPIKRHFSPLINSCGTACPTDAVDASKALNKHIEPTRQDLNLRKVSASLFRLKERVGILCLNHAGAAARVKSSVYLQCAEACGIYSGRCLMCNAFR
jgi:hypothetical protein